MRQFNTLTGFLLSKSSNPTINDTVKLEGYSDKGDGGGALWKHNGVTGQAASKSPTDLSSNLLNDASGNQWAIVVGQVLDYSGTQWFPLPFGGAGVGAYIYDTTGWAKPAVSELINDLSQSYIFPTVAAFKASLIEFPDGKTINLLDRGADFTKIAGTTGATGNGIIASASVSQSASIISSNDPRAWGAGGDGANVTTVLQEMADNGQNIYMKSAAGETLDWIVDDKIEVKFSKYSVKSTRSVKLSQTTDNTNIFYSEAKNDLTYKNLNLEGVGVADTASNANADIDTVNSQAIGIKFSQGSGLVVKGVTAKLFKNTAIQHRYSTNVRVENCDMVGTHPDPSIPVGSTAAAQFGLQCYASGWFAEGSSSETIRNKTATPHGNFNIRWIGNSVTNTAIAMFVSPGYRTVTISKNHTYGQLTQHSIYVNLEAQCIISNNILVAAQNTGIKIANNQLIEPQDYLVIGNVIKNFSAPGISIEVFDKDDLGNFSASKSRFWYFGIKIIGNQFEGGGDSAIIMACTHGGVIEDNQFRNISPIGIREVITLRSSSPKIKGNTLNGSTYAYLGGTPAIEEVLTLENESIDNSNKTGGTVVASSAVVATPIEVLAEERYYFRSSLVYNPANDNVYRVTVGGFSGVILPTGTGNTVSGDVTYAFYSAFADIRTKVTLKGNRIKNTEGQSNATKCFDFNDPKFEMTVTDNIVHQEVLFCNIQGLQVAWDGNNIQNTSRSSMIEPAYGTAGRGGNISYRTAIPTTGTHERDDTVYFKDRTANSRIGAICIVRGTPGIWREFGNIDA